MTQIVFGSAILIKIKMKRYFVIYVMLTFSLLMPSVIFGQKVKSHTVKLRYVEPRDRLDNFLPFRKLKRKKIGLALSGGGLRGLAHVGVLKVLEKEKIPVDYIAGTSIGAIVGGLRAIGYTPDEIEKMTGEIDWMGIFRDRPARANQFLEQKDTGSKYLFRLRFEGLNPYIPSALSKGQKLSDILSLIIMRATFIPYTNFDDFKIPFRAVATNLASGNKEVIGSGDLGRAMMGSSAAPLLFSPVEMGDKLLVDGGLVANIPSLEARSMGADYVIGVDATSPLKQIEDLHLPWEQADQTLTIMQLPANKLLLKECDLVISPDLGMMQSYDQNIKSDGIIKGVEAAEKLLPELKSMINYLPDDMDSTKSLCKEIKITGNKNILKEFIINELNFFKERYYSDRDIYLSLVNLYQSGYFEDVYANVSVLSGGFHLDVFVKENPVIKIFKFHGNTVVEDGALQGIMSDRTGRIFNFHAGEDLFQNILVEYRNGGYSLAEIAGAELDEKNICHVFINEGLIGEIVIKGNTHVRNYVIEREIPFKRNDVVSLQRIRTAVSNIYGTGLFERVYVTFSKEGPYRNLLIHVEEKKHVVLNFGAQYTKDIGTHGFVEYENEARFGMGLRETLHLRTGYKDQRYSYELKADRIFKTYFTFNIMAYFSEQKNYIRMTDNSVKDLRQIQKGIFFSFGHQLARLGTVQLEFKIERDEYRTFPDPDFNGGNEIRALTFRSIVDTRDRLPFPFKGKYHELYYETASRQVLEGSKPYVKFYSSLESYYTVAKYFTFRPRIRAGFADQTIPFSERFRIGGRDTFLGLKWKELHGRAMIAGNASLRFNVPFFKLVDMYLTARYDFAGFWETVEDIEGRDIIHGKGVSLAMQLPIGPMEITYGRAAGNRERVYFTLGYDF